MREAPPKLPNKERYDWWVYVKESTMPKTPMKEYMWMLITKTKTRKASNVFDKKNNIKKILIKYLNIEGY